MDEYNESLTSGELDETTPPRNCKLKWRAETTPQKEVTWEVLRQ